MTCGMYNGSGDFAVKVGLPAKSGVGGGIMAVSPARMGIGIYSPGLDEKGNSLAGIRLLEQLGRRLSLSIFCPRISAIQAKNGLQRQLRRPFFRFPSPLPPPFLHFPEKN